MARLDAIAAQCPAASVEGLRIHLFETLGFAGNRRRYDDPRNSYLDAVIARRRGLPITLAVLTIEVGRRLGLVLEPVGMPGHFLVGVGDGRYLDAFDQGRVLDESACRRRFVELHGPVSPWTADLLAPVGPGAVLARILANLHQLFVRSNDLVGLDWVLQLRIAIPGIAASERAERASVLSALGRYDEAASELELLANLHGPGGSFSGSTHPSGGADPSAGQQADELRHRAARLRARLN